MEAEKQILSMLEKEGIPFEVMQHPAVYTVPDMEALGICEKGTIAKNLFLRNSNGKTHYLVTLRHEKTADLKELRRQLGSTQLSFASPERLKTHLGLEPGAVTPFGVMNDAEAAVVVVFDRDLIGEERLGVHPNTNTATVFLAFSDLLRLVKKHGNPVCYVELG